MRAVFGFERMLKPLSVSLHRYDIGGTKPAIASPPWKFRMQATMIFLWSDQRAKECFIIILTIPVVLGKHVWYPSSDHLRTTRETRK